MTRTYWLSFCDGSLPKGSQFLGALVVDVTEADREAASEVLRVRFPNHDTDAGPWIAAATRKAHETEVNPGGEVMSVRMDELPHFAFISPLYPRLTLLSRPDIDAIDDQIDALAEMSES